MNCVRLQPGGRWGFCRASTVLQPVCRPKAQAERGRPPPAVEVVGHCGAAFFMESLRIRRVSLKTRSQFARVRRPTGVAGCRRAAKESRTHKYCPIPATPGHQEKVFYGPGPALGLFKQPSRRHLPGRGTAPTWAKGVGVTPGGKTRTWPKHRTS